MLKDDKAVLTVEITEPIFCIALIADVTPVAILPKAIKAGPSAATIPPIATIAVFEPSERPVNHCAKLLIFSTNFSSIGAREERIVFPKSAPASFKLLSASAALSGGSSVALKVSATVVPYSSIDAHKSSILNRPSRMAFDISAAPFVPKISCAIVKASVSVFAFLMLSMVFCKPSSIESPSFA